MAHQEIHVYYADDKMQEYYVREHFTTEIVEEPRFFNIKKYYGYMSVVLANLLMLIITDSKWQAVFHAFCISLILFFWILSHSDEQNNFDRKYIS